MQVNHEQSRIESRYQHTIQLSQSWIIKQESGEFTVDMVPATSRKGEHPTGAKERQEDDSSVL